MKKLELNLDDLQVESFVTTPAADQEEAGTVFGYFTEPVICEDPNQTAPQSCGGTCASCPVTCGWTCAPCETLNYNTCLC